MNHGWLWRVLRAKGGRGPRAGGRSAQTRATAAQFVRMPVGKAGGGSSRKARLKTDPMPGSSA